MNNPEIVQPQEFCINNIFYGTEYIIPIYQRNYAWTKYEIEQLLNDINDIPNEYKGKYYLGSLIVNQLGVNMFEVIDGQQRLTTLYLLLSFLNNDSVNNHSLRFEAREKSNKTIYDINKIKDTKSELEKNPWYSEEIIEGYSIIRKYFDEKPEGFVSDFKGKLSSITIIRTMVPKDINLNHYFEIMNTRGEQLELHEIVKARIIGAIKSDKPEIDKKDKIIASTIWDACAQMDKYVQMCFPVNIRNQLFGANWDTFEFNNFDGIRDAFKDEEYDDEKKLTLGNILSNPDKVQEKYSKKEEEEENERFESVITFPNFILQVNKAIKISKQDNDVEKAITISEQDNDADLDDKRFIEILKDNWENKENALNFIFSLLKYRYLFDRYIIKREYIGQYTVEGKWSLQRLEMYQDTKKPSYKATLEGGATEDDKIKSANINKQLRLLQSCLRITYTSPKSMHWIAIVLSVVNKNKDGKEIIKTLEKYCCKKIYESDFKHQTGFGISRIVFTYLDYILCRDNKNMDFQFQYRTSIEHFFPQHPINAENTFDPDQIDSFGNLALITVSANSKFSNMLPIHKIEQYNDVIEQSPKLMLMKELLNGNNRVWDTHLVEKHDTAMRGIIYEEMGSYGYYFQSKIT